MISDCELLGHPVLVDGGCPCGHHPPTPKPEAVTIPSLDRVWWAGIPCRNFGMPVQTCDHPPIITAVITQ